MSKRYVLNPETGRLVDAEGCAGLKIINQSIKQKKQVKYQSTKSNNTCKEGEKKVLRTINGEKTRICVPQTTLRTKCPKGEIKHQGKCIKKQEKPNKTRGRPKNNCKEGEKKVLRTINGEKTRICVPQTTLRAKCPKGEIKHQGKCIKKQDKPASTRKPGRPKKTKPVAQQTKTQQPKKTQTQTPKKTQLVGKDDVMQIKKEIQAYYDAIARRYIFDREEPSSDFRYVSEIYIDVNRLKQMNTFIKISGLSQEELKQTDRKVMVKYRYDESAYDELRNRYDYNPLDYSIKMFDTIIDNKSFPKDPTVKDDLKNYIREATKTIKGKVAS